MIALNHLFSGILFLSALTAALLAAFSARKRLRYGAVRIAPVPGALPMAVLMALCSIYASGYGMELLHGSPAWAYGWARFQYIALAFMPVAMLWLAVDYTRRILQLWQPLLRRLLGVLLVVGIFTEGFVQTNPLHRLFYLDITTSTSGPFPVAVFEKGFWFYVHLSAFILSAAGSAVLYLAALGRIRGMERRSLLVMLWTSAAALGMFALMISGMVPWNLDPGPLALILNSCFMIYGIFRAGLLEIGPLARRLVFDAMNEGVLVVSDSGVIADFNPAASFLFRELDPSVIGTRIDEVLPRSLVAFPAVGQVASLHRDSPQNPRDYEIRRVSVTDRRNRELGHAFIFRDVSEIRRYIESLEVLAAVDSLTGAWNRRHWLILAEAELERAGRSGNSLAILMMDIDFFKKVNDRYGHDTGDRVLKEVCAAISASLRRNDSLARYGGEEFCAILPEGGLDAAAVVAERTRTAVEALRLSADSGSFGVTISIGYAVSDPGAQDADIALLLKRADAALYAAKNAGRNRVLPWMGALLTT